YFYGDALGGFFYLDDYWELSRINSISVRSIGDIARLFEPFPSFLLYRPISTMVFYHLLRLAFGYNPFAYHATLIAFHVLNGVLVFFIGRHLFRSRTGGFLTSMLYAMAPGHMLAVYWMALFTMTGTAFFFFLALVAWFCMPGRWRVPTTFVLFLVALLSSEHAISLPLVLTASAILIDEDRDWKRLLRTQAPFYVVAVCYAGVKLWYIGHAVPIQLAADPYRPTLNPINILRQLGQYVGYAINLFYDPTRSDEA